MSQQDVAQNDVPDLGCNYLVGRFAEPRTLAIEENHFFDFLIGIGENKALMPPIVVNALADTGLLFLGFHVEDWDFRVPFHTVFAQECDQRLKEHAHVVAQVDPEHGGFTDPLGARRYLEKYFNKADIIVYWGTVRDFLSELLDRYTQRYGSAAVSTSIEP